MNDQGLALSQRRRDLPAGRAAEGTQAAGTEGREAVDVPIAGHPDPPLEGEQEVAAGTGLRPFAVEVELGLGQADLRERLPKPGDLATAFVALPGGHADAAFFLGAERLAQGVSAHLKSFVA